MISLGQLTWRTLRLIYWDKCLHRSPALSHYLQWKGKCSISSEATFQEPPWSCCKWEENLQGSGSRVGATRAKAAVGTDGEAGGPCKAVFPL